MKRFRFFFPLSLSALALALGVGSQSAASDDNRVAVVVNLGEEVVTRCVAFTEPEITGFQALERSGLPLEIDLQAGGAAVCRIDGAGCPSDDCFCSCRGGGDCLYWSYWHLTAGAWQYATGGAGVHKVSDGMVDGWVWGPGSVTQATPPPVVTFDEVCVADGSPDTIASAPSGAAVALPGDDISPPSSTDAGGPVDWRPYAGFIVVVGVLGALGLLGRRRARRS